MKSDRAKHNVLPPSKFGVVEITRQRVRPETDIDTAERCPCCKGTGKVEATILLTDEIENQLRYLTEEKKMKKLSLHVHPFMEAYLNKGLFSSARKKWAKKYKVKIKVNPITAYNLLEYHYHDQYGEEIVE